MPQYNDYPLYECAEAAAKLIAKGAEVFQKFTCTGCGSRQAMDTPNVFYTTGECQECGAVTDIALKGCNYLVSASGKAVVEVLKEFK